MEHPSFSPPKGTDDGLVILGRVAGIHGVRGWVKVYSYTRVRTDILQYSPWLLKVRDGTWKAYTVQEGRQQGQGIVASLAGCEDRDQAKDLVDAQIAIQIAQLPPPALGEFYWAQLEGFKVVNLEGVELGRVSHLFETGANDVLVVRAEAESPPRDRPAERLIPYVRGVVRSVDLQSRVIHVDWETDF